MCPSMYQHLRHRKKKQKKKTVFCRTMESCLSSWVTKVILHENYLGLLGHSGPGRLFSAHFLGAASDFVTWDMLPLSIPIPFSPFSPLLFPTFLYLVFIRRFSSCRPVRRIRSPSAKSNQSMDGVNKRKEQGHQRKFTGLPLSAGGVPMIAPEESWTELKWNGTNMLAESRKKLIKKNKLKKRQASLSYILNRAWALSVLGWALWLVQVTLYPPRWHPHRQLFHEW